MSVGSTFKTIGGLALFAGASLLIGAPSSPAPTPRAAPLRSADWLDVETDACGDVDKVLNRHSARKGRPTADPVIGDDGGYDEDDWVNAWDMSPEESAALNDWLSQHPELATITEAVEKSCDDQSAPIDDRDDIEIA